MLHTWLDLRPFERWLACCAGLMLCTFRLWLVADYPLHIDEAFSYALLVDRGLLVTMLYYPGPNNHIGFLVWPALLNHLLADPVWTMRLPALVVSGGLTGWLWLRLVRAFGYWPATVAVHLWSWSEYGLRYAVQGRGYGLLLACALWALHTGMRYRQNRDALSGVYMALALGYGCWTSPAFVYPWATGLLWLLLCRLAWPAALEGRTLGGLMRWMAVGGMLTLLLYTPVALLNGLSAIVANPWVQPMSATQWVKEFPAYFYQVQCAFYADEQRWIFGLNMALYCGAVAALAIRSCRVLAVAWLLISLWPYMQGLLMQVQAPMRVLWYKSLVEWLAWGWLLAKVTARQRLQPWLLAVVMLCWAMGMGLLVRKRNHQPDNLYTHASYFLAGRPWMQPRWDVEPSPDTDAYQILLRAEAAARDLPCEVRTTPPFGADHRLRPAGSPPLPPPWRRSYADPFVEAWQREGAGSQ